MRGGDVLELIDCAEEVFIGTVDEYASLGDAHHFRLGSLAVVDSKAASVIVYEGVRSLEALKSCQVDAAQALYRRR